MINISKTISVKVSIKFEVCEEILIGVDCTSKESKSYKILIQEFDVVLYCHMKK